MLMMDAFHAMHRVDSLMGSRCSPCRQSGACVEPRDLAKTWPVEMRYGFSAGRNRTRFNAAMGIVERLSRAQIRGRTVVATPALN